MNSSKQSSMLSGLTFGDVSFTLANKCEMRPLWGGSQQIFDEEKRTFGKWGEDTFWVVREQILAANEIYGEEAVISGSDHLDPHACVWSLSTSSVTTKGSLSLSFKEQIASGLLGSLSPHPGPAHLQGPG